MSQPSLDPEFAGTAVPTDRPVARLDARDLPPPEPLRETLERTVDLGETVLVQRNDRVPQHLFPRLDERGLAHETVETDAGVLTAVWDSDPDPDA
ncbi:MAG: DUF2249 domain-containing protein [Haloarculaceae archaeon]